MVYKGDIKPAKKNTKKNTEKAVEKLKEAYDHLDVMLEVCRNSYPEFNQNGEGKDRTLRQFTDDNDKRANSYVPSREAQGKDSWQANVFTPTTRNKVKALIAGVAKNPPEIAMEAINSKNQESAERAEVMKMMVESSFLEGDQNPEIQMFFESWNCAIKGTVIELDDYIRIKDKVKVITDYDPNTGEVSFEEEEVYVQDEAVSIEIPLSNFLIWNPQIRDVQKQPRIAWIDYKDEDEAEYEFGEFKKWGKVKEGTAHFTPEEMDTFFLKRWQERTKASGKKYEVIRLYDKMTDNYMIIVNGVILLDSPLLWGKKKKKYPFSKTIFEPFANSNFFWGNCLPNILMGEQDLENAFVNSLTDKTYRSLNKPLLIGRVNRDNFDLEDEWVDSDTKIYVEDISQVTSLPSEGANPSEIAMLQLIQSGLSNDSTDSAQSGQAGSGSTAREIVIANERADELKGLFFTFMKDLWLQKYRLRALNIAANYGTAKVIELVGEDGEKIIEKSYKSFRLHNAELSNGRKGKMRIDVVEDMSQQKKPFELDVEETKAQISGDKLEIMQITSDWLDEYEYGIRIMTNSIFQKSRALKMAEGTEKIGGIASMFPEIFMQNKELLFQDYIELYGDNPDRYDTQSPQVPQGIPGMPGDPTGQALSPTQIQDQGALGQLPPLPA